VPDPRGNHTKKTRTFGSFGAALTDQVNFFFLYIYKYTVLYLYTQLLINSDLKLLLPFQIDLLLSVLFGNFSLSIPYRLPNYIIVWVLSLVF